MWRLTSITSPITWIMHRAEYYLYYYPQNSILVWTHQLLLLYQLVGNCWCETSINGHQLFHYSGMSKCPFSFYHPPFLIFLPGIMGQKAVMVFLPSFSYFNPLVTLDQLSSLFLLSATESQILSVLAILAHGKLHMLHVSCHCSVNSIFT